MNMTKLYADFENEQDLFKKFILWHCYVLKGGKRRISNKMQNIFAEQPCSRTINLYFSMLSAYMLYQKTGYCAGTIVETLCDILRNNGYTPTESCYDRNNCILIQVKENSAPIQICKDGKWFTDITRFFISLSTKINFNSIEDTVLKYIEL